MIETVVLVLVIVIITQAVTITKNRKLSEDRLLNLQKDVYQKILESENYTLSQISQLARQTRK